MRPLLLLLALLLPAPAAAQAADTLVATGAVTMPADDGLGPIDSLRVALYGVPTPPDPVTGLSQPPMAFWRPAPPFGAQIAYTLTVALPPRLVSRTTFTVWVEATLWRGTEYIVVETPKQDVVLTGAIVPPPVLGPLTVTVP